MEEEGLKAYIALNIAYYIINLLRINPKRELEDIEIKIIERFSLSNVKNTLSELNNDNITYFGIKLMLINDIWNPSTNKKRDFNSLIDKYKRIIVELYNFLSLVEEISDKMLERFLSGFYGEILFFPLILIPYVS